MVFDIVGPLRGFATQEEAKHFVGNDSGLTIVPIPKRFKTIEVEECLFLKTCFKCNELKPLLEFYKHKAMSDGYVNKCKDCTKQDLKNNRYGANRHIVKMCTQNKEK
jgi:hypothetical protein